MMTILTIIQVLIAMAMIGIILVQRGPGASAGSGFGAGASATVFGARGSGSFLTRTTAILAAGFFGISMLMAVLVSHTMRAPEQADLGVMAGEAAPREAAGTSEGPAVEALEGGVPDAGARGTVVDDVPTAPADEEGPDPDGSGR